MSGKNNPILDSIKQEFRNVSYKRLAILCAAGIVAVFLWNVGEDVLEDTDAFGNAEPAQSEQLDLNKDNATPFPAAK